MYCMTCNYEVKTGSKFCSECGSPQIKNASIKTFNLPVTDDDFVIISCGKFEMGSPVSETSRYDDESQHTVYIESFEIMKAPITNEQYQKYCKEVGKEIPICNSSREGSCPVSSLSYWDAVDFCQWLTRLEGRKHRLPTEAEWEFACRAGSSTAYWYGDLPERSEMHYGDEPRPSLVGNHQANKWGLYDMHGNVYEWCASEYDENYDGKEAQDASSDRTDNTHRVYRGGAWFEHAGNCRSARRRCSRPDNKVGGVGFRIARELRSNQ